MTASASACGIALALASLGACAGSSGTTDEAPARVDALSPRVTSGERHEEEPRTGESEPPQVSEATSETPAADAPAACSDEARAARAVAATLAHAESEGGVAPAHLAGCAFDAARCDAEQVAEPDGARCVVDVRTDYGRWQVTVHPAIANGAPRSIDASLAAVSEPPGRMWISSSTWAVARRSAIVVAGVDGRAGHTHGGDAARVGSAHFLVRNDTGAPLRVAARRVDWLTAHSCLGPLEERARPRIAGLAVEGSASEASHLVLPAGESRFSVRFEPQAAYYTHCDRFAARVTLDVGGEMLVVTAETLVSRREPVDVP
jgi:hypothetical protein